MPAAVVRWLLALLVWPVSGSVEGCRSCEAGDEVVRLRCELNKVTSLLNRTVFFSEEQLALIQGELGQLITAALQARREKVGGAVAPIGKATRNEYEGLRVRPGDGKPPPFAAVSRARSPPRPSLGSLPPEPRPRGGLSGVDAAARPREGRARGVGWPGGGLGPDLAALGGWSGQGVEGQARSHRQTAETASLLAPRLAASGLPAAVACPACGPRPPCADSPAGWVDKDGHGCAEYAARQWCAGDGGPGPGWPASRGSLADQANGRHTAATACCACRPQATDAAGRGCDHYARHPLQCGCCDDEHFVGRVACADVCSLGNRTARRRRSLQTWTTLSAFIAAIPSYARGIALPGYGLAGTLPAELGRFVDLQYLDLRGNRLTGTLPRELGTLTQLRYLSLGGNAFVGTVPGELGNLRQLQELHLDGNNLMGTLPRELGGLTQLLHLNVSINQIEGTLPTELGNLKNLWSLSFWSNKLTGTLPKELGTLTELQYLGACYNRFTGTLPCALGNLSKLQQLWVNGNLLTGTLPMELGGLNSVQLLIFADNELTGTLPDVLGTLTELQALDTSGNHFMGTLPKEVGNLAKLQLLNVSNNQLTGTLPSELRKVMYLQVLNLGANQFTGTLPSDLGKLTSLQVLSVAANRFTGTLPSELGNLTSLHVLSVAANQFTGTLPKELGNLTMLQMMLAFSNRLTGPLPSELGNLKALRALDVSANALTGTLPHELGSLTMLQRLSLCSNSFTGILPRELRKLTSLQVLVVCRNLLTGTLPSELGSMTSLQTFDASRNQIFGTLPSEFGKMTALQLFAIVDNQFSGTLPSELGNMTALQTLDVQGNRFVGTLPEELCKLAQLQALSVARNQLTGTLPSEIGKLAQLLRLHIETNQFTGTLPSALGGLTQLEEFAAFQNKFTGTLPSELGKMTGLQRLSFYSNRLTGALPRNLGNLTNLLSLDASDNLFTGTLPKELGRLTNLLDLRLDANAFTGAVPKEVGLLRRTTVLYLQNNNLTELPRELGQMEALVNLNVQGNPFLLGAFPDTSACHNLTTISASNCSFVTAGAVGPMVTMLSFAQNKFAFLPEAWVELPSVVQLDLSDNRLATWAPFGVLPLGTFAPGGAREKCGVRALARRLDWPAMEQVKLSGNPFGQSITVRDFLWSLGYLPRLSELFAARCGLRGDVPYEGDFLAMDMVDTGEMDCTQMPAERIGFPDLLMLDLSGNSIRSILAPPPARLIGATLHSNALAGVALNTGWFSVFGTLEVWDNPLLRAAVAPPKVCQSQGEEELAADMYSWGGSLDAFECTVLCPGTRSHYKHDTWLNVSRLCRCKAGMQGSGMDCTGCPRDAFSDMDPADPEGMARTCHPCPVHATTDVENATSIDQCLCSVGWYMGAAPAAEDNTTNSTDDDGARKLAAVKACVRCPQAPFMTTARGAISVDQCVCNPAYGGLRELVGKCGCDDGMYMDHAAKECVPCDHAAEDCTWGVDVQHSLEPPVIKASYWAAPPEDVHEGALSNFSGNEIWRCFSKDTCRRGGACADGRQGRACSLCEEGMFGGPDGACKPCPRSPPETRKLLGLALLVGPLATMWAHIMVQSGDDRTGQLFQRLRALGTSLKQLLKYMQLLGVLSVFSVSWPPQARQFFADIMHITVAMPQIAGPACLTGKQTVALEMGFRWLLPVAGLVSTCLTGLLLLPLRRCCRGRRWHACTKMGAWDAVRVCVWGLVLFYSTLLQFGTQVLTCEASPNGRYTVHTFPHLECSSREWGRLAAVSICFLVVFVLAVFAGVYGAWRRATHALVQSDLKSKGWWGFLFDGYRRGSVHWVMLIMLRDMVLVVIATAGAGDGPGQLVATAGVSIVYSYVVLRDQPYVEPSNSLLEAWTSMSLAALCIFSAGMGYQSTPGVEDVAELFSDGANDALYESRAQAMLVVQWCTLLGPICILTFQCATMFSRVRRRIPASLRPMEEEQVQSWNLEFLQSLGLQGDAALRGVIEGLDYVEGAQFRALMGSTAVTIGISSTTSGMIQGAGRRRMSWIARADHGFVPLAKRTFARLSGRRTSDRPSGVDQPAHDGDNPVHGCERSWPVEEDTTVASPQPSVVSKVVCSG